MIKDSLELDEDDYNASDLSSPLTTGKEDMGKKMSENNIATETTILANPFATSSQDVPVSTSTSFKKADKKKAHIKPVIAEKSNGFAFSITSDPDTLSQPPPTPTMPTPLLDRPNAQREQTTSPMFTLGSKDAKLPVFSSPTVSVNDAAGAKVSEGSQSDSVRVTRFYSLIHLF